MIAACAFFALQTQRLVRSDVPSPDQVSFCIAAPLPKLGYKDLELFEVGLRTLTKGSQEYSPPTIRQVTEGHGIMCKLLGDSALVMVTVPKGAANSGLDLLASLMRSPTLDQDDLDTFLRTQAAPTSSYWNDGMHPEKFDLGGAPRDDVLAVFQRVFRPDRIVVAFGGAIGQTDVAQLWTDHTQGWTPPKEPRFPDDSVPHLLMNIAGPVTVTELIGTSFKASNPDLPSYMLALYALGSGKGSSLYRIAREQHAWSYRQEAYLWPTTSGWEPRLFIPMIGSSEAANRIQSLKQELQTDVANWTETDRLRAIGMAESTLLGGLPYGPLLLGDSPIGDTLQDKVAMAAYWRMKTGADWDPQVLFQQISKVDLDGLKASARAILEGSRPSVLPGRGSAAGGP